jgi:hypothetical protein
MMVREIADELGRAKSHIHRVVGRLGIEIVKQKGEHTRGQVAHFIRAEDYPKILEHLTPSSDEESNHEAVHGTGSFYLISLEPDLDPGRFKVGFGADVNERLRRHKTSAPFARVIKTWPCRGLWEKTAIDCISQGCERLHTEVFRAQDIGEVLRKGDSFFGLMPELADSEREGRSTP